MRTSIPIVLVATLFFGPIATMAQLPPEILVDSYLLRVEQAIRDGDKDQARAGIDKIILLQKEQELKLSEEFLFRYAKAAAAADRPDQALESVTKYLTVAGRDSQHYFEALELMNQMQDAIAGRREVQVVSPGPPASPQTIQGSDEAVPATGGSTDEQRDDEVLTGATTAPAGCELWNTEEYFNSASLENVKACLEAGTEVAARTEDGHTPLHLAAQYNEDPSVVKALLAAGADLNAKATKDEHMPLHEAAKSNPNPDVLQALLTAGADRMARDGNGASLLCWAAGNENPAVIELLLQAGMDPKTPDNGGYTPLHYGAFYNENPQVLHVLLTAGADPMARNQSQDTPLHVAAKANENPEVVRALLTAGAELMAQDEYQNTPLHNAAASNENPEVLKTLLTAGADPMARDKFQNTPLHDAARYNKNPAVIQSLLDGGANLEARNDDGETPLHGAAFNNDLAVVEALITAGANMKARDKFGRTLLHEAATANDPAVIQAILKRGLSARARDTFGQTPLHQWSVVGSDPAVVQMLLAAGADLDAQDESGDTPLHAAATSYYGSSSNRSTTVIGTLLDAGADAGAKNDAGKTPWDLAQENKTLKETEGYWRLNEARFEASGSGSRRTPATRPPTDKTTTASAAGGPCLIPGYPSPPGGVANLGLPSCPATVGFQARAFALQAAGAQCAIATGSSSTPEQIQARRQEIKVACERLAALGVPNCRCP